MITSDVVKHLLKLPQGEECFLYVDGEIREIAGTPHFDDQNFEVVGNFITAE